MPILQNYVGDAGVIKLEFDLHNGDGFFFDKDESDYLNWIPYELNLTVGKDKYMLKDYSLSLEGLKCFLCELQAVLDEKDVTKTCVEYKRDKSKEYEEHYYCGCEAEFTITLRNTEDFFDKEIVLIEVWISSACLPEPYSGYSIGYRFNITYENLEQFTKDLKKQLKEIIQI